MDPAGVRSFRSISNLSVMPKLLDCLVAKQLVEWLSSLYGLFRLSMQSAYRALHSTETAMLRVLSDILKTIDAGNLAVLALFDTSVAFDTVDHTTLLQRLKTTYGLVGTVLKWISSYFNDITRVWGSARIGVRTYPLSVIHSRPAESRRTAPAPTSPIRG